MPVADATREQIERWIDSFEDDKVYGAPELEERGMFARSHFFKLVQRGELPAIRMGERQGVKVPGADLKKWLRSRIVTPTGPRPNGRPRAEPGGESGEVA